MFTSVNYNRDVLVVGDLIRFGRETYEVIYFIEANDYNVQGIRALKSYGMLDFSFEIYLLSQNTRKARSAHDIKGWRGVASPAELGI